MSDYEPGGSFGNKEPRRWLPGPTVILAFVALGAATYGVVTVVNRMPGLENRLSPPEPPAITILPEENAPAQLAQQAEEETVVATGTEAVVVDTEAVVVEDAESEEAEEVAAVREDAPGADDTPASDATVAEAATSGQPKVAVELATDDPVPAEQSATDIAVETAEAAPETEAETESVVEEPVAEEASEAVADAPEAVVTPVETDETETVAVVDSDDDATPVEVPPAEVTPADAPLAAVIEPTFDIIRIDATGSGIVAGRAEPGSMVQILSEGAVELATVEASATGEFVAFIQTPSQDEGQVLSLSAQLGGQAIGSEESVLVLPGQADDADAPLVVRADEEGVRVVQPSALGKVDGVTLDSISYDEEGAVKLAGRASAAGPIRIYVDGIPVGAAEASPAGTWDATLDSVKEGRYILRVDALNADGSVSSRAESPFQRVFPTAEQRKNPTQITVQPGNTLWVMAVDRYGDGLLYTQIFQANSEAIRDPDLIYPGQIFALPDEEEFGR